MGVGTDVVDLDRFRRIVEERPRMIARLFTDAEREVAERRRDPAQPLAARFAAKEAAMKAMGVGLGEVRFHDLEVARASSGAPSLVVRGSALVLAEQLGIERWHVSLSHSQLVAQAVVIASG